MTQIITRYFENAADARAVKKEFVYRRSYSLDIVSLFETAEGLVDTLTAEQVAPATAKAYQDLLASGGAVLLVKAGARPLRVAQTTRQVTAQMGAADLGDLVQEVTVKDTFDLTHSSVLTNHPKFLTRQRDPNSTNYHMANWPIPLISRRKPPTKSLVPPHARMANFPIPLISKRKPYTGSIIAPHQRMANFPLPLISKRKPYTKSIFAPHARMANFPIPLLSKRKPYTKSIFPRHQRMATVPFPLLINGKTGTNALIPGAPRMANFPIPLLSSRKPFNESIFPRHARMANFPIPLLSSRKPYTKSILEPHQRMANFPWPLVISRSKTAAADGGTGFSFSKMMKWPTVIRR